MSGASNENELRDRLATVQVSLRCEVEVTRDTFRGVPAYVVRDTVTSATQRVSASDYAVLAALDGRHPLGEVFNRLVGARKLKASSERDFYNFVLELHRAGFLNLPIPGGDALYERFQRRRREAIAKKFTGFLFMQVPLFSPDRFLNRTVDFVRPLFTRWFFAVWLLLMGVGATIVVDRWDDLASPFSALLGDDAWMATLIVLVFLKVIHEFGHAYACKSFGGSVPEMGVTFIVLTPLAYVDATSAWGFPRQRDRIIVSLAGMYFEMFFAAMAIVVWAMTPPGAVNSIAYQAFLLGSLVTIVFNINPLMRFDGYYLLSDMLGIPNLRGRSMKFLRRVFDRVVLGLPNPDRSFSATLKLILFTYGISASIYRVVLVLGISAMIATKLYFVGVALGAVYIAQTLLTMMGKTARHLWVSPETAPARVRAVAVSIVIFAGIPVAVSTVEVGVAVEASGTVEHAVQTVVRSAADGVLVEYPAKLGKFVQPGSPLASLDNREYTSRLRELQTRLDRTDVEIGIQQLVDRPAAAQTRMRREYYTSQVQRAATNVENLQVLAGAHGTVVRKAPLPLGSRVVRGTEIATIAHGPRVARFLVDSVVLTEAGLAVGDRVPCRFVAYPKLVVHARVERIAPVGTRAIEDVALTNVAGGDIVVDPIEREAQQAYFEVTTRLEDADLVTLRTGMTTRLRLASPERSLARHVYERVLVFLDRLQSGGA